MGINIRGRSFLTLLDFTPAEINYMLDLSAEFKRMKNNGVEHKWLTGKQVVLLFEKTSTRTRCAFEVGARDLGMGVTFLDPGFFQVFQNTGVFEKFLEKCKSFFGIQVCIAQHFLDPGTFHHEGVFFLGRFFHCIGQIFLDQHVLREKFLFEYNRLVVCGVQDIFYMIHQFLQSLAADCGYGKYFDSFRLKFLPDFFYRI